MMAKTGCCHGLHPHMRGRIQSAPYAGGVNIPPIHVYAIIYVRTIMPQCCKLATRVLVVMRSKLDPELHVLLGHTPPATSSLTHPHCTLAIDCHTQGRWPAVV